MCSASGGGGEDADDVRVVSVGCSDGLRDRAPRCRAGGFDFDNTQFYIGGFDPANTRRTRNIQAGNDKVARVIDELASVNPWSPRYLRVYGTAALIERRTQWGERLVMKITPTVSWSVNLSGEWSTGRHEDVAVHKTIHRGPGADKQSGEIR